MSSRQPLDALLCEIRACRICAEHLPLGPRPVLRAKASARLLIVGQAPGTKVHESGVPWSDRSGDRLREWLRLDRDAFYDESRVAIVPMGFCYPGVDKNGGDRPPRPECAPLWHPRLLALLPRLELTLLVVYLGLGTALRDAGDLTARSSAYYVLAVVAVLAMGLQTAALRHVCGVLVHTTFITGMVTNLAEELVATARHDPDAPRRARVHGGLVSAYIVGAQWPSCLRMGPERVVTWSCTKAKRLTARKRS